MKIFIIKINIGLVMFLLSFGVSNALSQKDEVSSLSNFSGQSIKHEDLEWLKELELLHQQGNYVSINLINDVENDPHIGSRPSAMMLKLEMKNYKDLMAQPLKLYLKLLNHQDPIIASASAIALGYYKNKKAVEPLISKITNAESVYLQDSIVIAFGLIGDTKPLNFLHNAIGDCKVDNSIDHSLIFETIEKINDKSSIPHIIQYLECSYGSSSTINRSSAIRALSSFDNLKVETKLIEIVNDINESCYCRYEAVEILGNNLNKKSYDTMLSLLKRQDKCLTRKLLLIFSENKDKKIIPIIEKIIIETQDNKVKKVAMKALNDIKASID